MRSTLATLAAILAASATACLAGDAGTAADRGRDVMTLRKSPLPGAWSREAFDRLPSTWTDRPIDPESSSEAVADAIRRRYGLHPAPYPNDGLPMGLRTSAKSGISVDCMICHGGSIGGKGYVGLGNTQLDMDALVKEMLRADGKPEPVMLFNLTTSRGTNNAGMAAAVLLSFRNTDLSMRRIPVLFGKTLPELDTPAWWLLRKKSTKYYDGRTAADDHRSNMQFYLGEFKRADFESFEPAFRDTEDYLRSLEPPKYPFEVDSARAEKGRAVFEANCSKCHGTYGADETYPNEIVPLDVIGTDRARAEGISDRLVTHYNASWFGDLNKVDVAMIGYQAPPLDGVWATAPYLHNGSVPTLHALLKSTERPARYLRPSWTGFDEYDRSNVGWFSPPAPADPKAARIDPKRVVDASRWGFGNGGHTFGDGLTEPARMDLIEYLKTL